MITRIRTTITQPRAWVAISLGVAFALLLLVLVQGGDGNAGGVYSLDEQREVLEVCPGSEEHDQGARACVAEMSRRCWHQVEVVVVDECESPKLAGVARLQPCESSSICDEGAGHGTEHPGAERGGDIYLRSAFELTAVENPGDELCHELQHGLYGLVEHDEHATRIGAMPAGTSWVGLDRCPGGDFDGSVVR